MLLCAEKAAPARSIPSLQTRAGDPYSTFASTPQLCVAYSSLRATDCKPSKAKAKAHGARWELAGAPLGASGERSKFSLSQHARQPPCSPDHAQAPSVHNLMKTRTSGRESVCAGWFCGESVMMICLHTAWRAREAGSGSPPWLPGSPGRGIHPSASPLPISPSSSKEPVSPIPSTHLYSKQAS